MNILYLQYANPWNPHSRGGVDRVNHEVFQHLAQSHSIVVVTGYMEGKPVEALVDGVLYRQAGTSRHKIVSRVQFSIAAMTVDLKPHDLVIVAWDRYAPVHIRLDTKPYVLELHANYFQMPAKVGLLEPATRSLLRLALNRAPYLSTVSRFLLEMPEIRQRRFHLSEVVYNGVSEDCFSEPGDLKDGSYLLFIGRLDIRTKGIDTLLSAYQHSGLNIPLLIAGDGKDKLLVESLIRSKGLRGRVRMEGWVEGRRKQELIQGCIAVCVPSRSEGFGLVAIEAMAMGRPVVGSLVEGLNELVEHGISGLLFEKESIDGCANAMQSVSLDIQLRTRLMKGARARAEQFAIRNTVQGREKLFQEVLKDHNQSERKA